MRNKTAKILRKYCQEALSLKDFKATKFVMATQGGQNQRAKERRKYSIMKRSFSRLPWTQRKQVTDTLLTTMAEREIARDLPR